MLCMLWLYALVACSTPTSKHMFSSTGEQNYEARVNDLYNDVTAQFPISHVLDVKLKTNNSR